MSSMRIAGTAVAALLTGLAIGALLSRGLHEAPPVPAPRTEIALRDALDQERRSRQSLEAEVAALRAALTVQNAASEPDEREPAAPPDEVPEALDPDADAAFDEAALLAVGFRDAEIERLREQYERYELDRLYLENLARREGRLGRGDYQRELRALREGLRADLGDDDYDAMLYAAGRKNRVIVSDLLANSAAEAAGLRPGDALIRYDGERIFDPYALVKATARGRPGALTELRVERRGEEIRLFLPRGPIGVRLSRERRAPDVPR